MITGTTQIHQPITFDYFEHQLITDKWAKHVASAHARAGTIETILVRRKFAFLRLGSIFRQTIHKEGGFQQFLQDDYLSSKPYVEGELFPLTFALLGGGGVFEHPPLRFFADSKKTAARSAAGFSPTLFPIFLATFVKVSILGHARSGHQVRSSDHTLQKLYNRAPATVFEGKLWNFRNIIRSSVPTKRVSWIFYIGDLRSGHFRDRPIISQWAKIKLPVLCFILSLHEWNRIR